MNLQINTMLKEKGFKITRVRKNVLDIFTHSKEPLSVGELIGLLLKRDISVNKTTIYREIEFLLKANLLTEVDFGDRKKRYELLTNDHHHHILCLSCGKIEDIDFDVDLKSHEEEIKNNTGFKIVEHTIEFFGYCKKCQH